MTDQISISGIEVFAYHGVLDHEKTEGQLFGIDVTLDVDLTSAAASDELADTVDYGEWKSGVRVEGGSYSLVSFTRKAGQGIGSALMQPALAKADAAHLPAYLETQKEINVKLYQKHGFDVVVETNLPDNGPHVWCMKRPAR